jgi:hypothetical protein
MCFLEDTHAFHLLLLLLLLPRLLALSPSLSLVRWEAGAGKGMGCAAKNKVHELEDFVMNPG